MPADGEKAVLIVNVPKGSQRPYRTNRGRYYVRTSSGCRDASQADLLRLFQAVESLFYDETPLARLRLADLDLDDVERYLQKVGAVDLDPDRERLLRNWGLLQGEHPTIAGIVLFAREPQRHLPFAQINAARFPGTDSAAEPLDRKDLTGRLLDVIDAARQFLLEHLRVPHRIRGFEPEPKPELPEEALREAVVNAVAHRDYTVHGPVRLFVFDDRIEIRTPGRPPNAVTPSAMRAGVHVPRNPHIYARLADAGLVTRAGTGIRRISRLVRQATGHDIGLDVLEAEVVLTIPRVVPATAAP
ncbi:MAG: ATP-binding protein [Myxococcota bacterium]|nr:ATP-binding protein [Myxococcota bacterium]